MPTKRILVVAESINVDDSSGSKANVAIIHNLKKAGYKLLVLHYTRKNIQLYGVECQSIEENRSSLYFFLSRIQRKLQHWFNLNLAKYLEPVFGFSFTFFNDTKSIERKLKTINTINFDIVLTLSKGASFRPHYSLLNLPELHEKWMAYIHDPYPFHYYPEPFNWSEPGYMHKIKFFHEVAQNCCWAAFPSLHLAHWMTKHYSDFQEKFLIIPHQKIIDSFTAEIPNYFDINKLIFLHAGTLLPERDPDPLIQAFKKLIQNYPSAKENLRLMFIGNISEKFHDLREKNKGVKQIIFKDYVDFEVVKRMQKLASVNIILESSAEASPFLPGKFPHCVAANKSILHLGPVKSEMMRLLGDEYAYHVEAGDVDRIASILERLYLKWQEDPKSLKLDRDDLQFYISEEYLKKQINNLK